MNTKALTKNNELHRFVHPSVPQPEGCLRLIRSSTMPEVPTVLDRSLRLLSVETDGESRGMNVSKNGGIMRV
jgi:hypothetical protein